MKYNLRSVILSVAAISFLVGCGGDARNDSGPSESEDGRAKKVISNPTPTPAPASFTKVDNWELSDDGAPKFALNTPGEITNFSNVVYSGHPRLYFRDTDKAHLDSMTNTAAWRGFKAVLTDNRIPASISVPDAITKLDGYERDNTEYPKMLTFLAYMEDDAHYVAIAKAWALDLATRLPEVNQDDDGPLRRRIERLSEAYDWLHDKFTSTERASLRVGLKRHLDKLMTYDYMRIYGVNPGSTTNYIQKHSRWGHGVAAQALLAMYGDFDASFTKSYADNLLKTTRENLRRYIDAEAYIASDGGWHLGWGYAYYNANYMFNYFIWSTATNETLLDDWMGDMYYWYLYALRADKTLPQAGDATVTDMGFGVLAALYQSKFHKDGYAKWYLNENAKIGYGDLVSRFIMHDNVTPQTPDTTLPTSRYFKKVGTVIARDTWEFDKATLLTFKSSPFYSAGHHHRDENSFTIDYKTALALDSGFYDETDKPQYKNYYIRTIAHNAITVYNPNQTMYYHTDYNKGWTTAQKRLINDGGQIFKDPDSETKADIVEGGKNRLDGIMKYQKNDNYTYMLGDATKAYDPATVTLAQREVVYVQDSGYTHPVVLVLDKIEATSGSFKKRYLLHTQPDTVPVISGKEMRVVVTDTKTHASSQMINKTLYPTNATLIDVAGFKLMDGSTVQPEDVAIVNVIRDDTDDKYNTKYGTHRLEVSPPTGNNYDVMLNAIFVGDKGETIPTQNALLINGSNSVGVQLLNRVVVFPKAKNGGALTYSVAKDANVQHTVATGLAKGATVKIQVNSEAASVLAVGDGGCVDFKMAVKTGDIIKVTP